MRLLHVVSRLEHVTSVTQTHPVNSQHDTGHVKNGKEIVMPMGKGTYGNKVGRPPAKKKKKAMPVTRSRGTGSRRGR